VIACAGGVLANRSGMIGSIVLLPWPIASGSIGNGFFRRICRVLSDGALISSIAASSEAPNASRCAQRLMLARASRASTGVLSWNSRLSRSVRVHSLPSFSMVWPATICGCGLKSVSMP
jgi:hypothetical protein